MYYANRKENCVVHLRDINWFRIVLSFTLVERFYFQNVQNYIILILNVYIINKNSTFML